jgi:3-oxoacyl-[acyl-carrier protein] reductase
MTNDTVPRHIVVLGGAGGIGQAIAMRFAQQPGANVYVLGRNTDKLVQASATMARDSAASFVPVACDLADPEGIAQALAGVPRLDVLVNAAGSIPRKSLLESQPDDWRGAWSDKVLGAIESSRLACERMRESGGGVIINIIGVSGVRLNPKSILTTTANAALIAFTQSLGAQSVDWNVRVVGINPGLTATARTADLSGGKGGDAYAKQLLDLPFKRMGHAQEIADCAWFLASESAQYISGTVIDVDGGARWRS